MTRDEVRAIADATLTCQIYDYGSSGVFEFARRIEERATEELKRDIATLAAKIGDLTPPGMRARFDRALTPFTLMELTK